MKIKLNWKCKKIIFALVIFLNSLVYSYGQNEMDSKVSINLKNARLTEIFSTLKSKTRVDFTYGEYILNNDNLYNLTFNDEPLKNILNFLASKANFDFIYQNKSVIVSKSKNETKALSQNSQIEITGTVIDENGLPLPGANIIEKGTNNGISCDFDGKFSLKVTNEESVIQISFISYLSQELKVGKLRNFTVKLFPESKTLDEVVVVGYGVQKKENVTGSISTIKAEEFQNNLGTSTGQLLQGIAPNLNVTLSDGDINNEASINIRGIGSINGGNPLILIDGVEGNINRLNPRDIESISVLKDAASASIYGARASFGVILVTTKKAKEGEIKINYTNNFGWSTPTIRTDNFITDGLEWARLSDKLSLLENTSTYLGYTAEDYAYLEARKLDPSLPSVLIKTVNGVERYVHYGNTDWWNTIFEDRQAQSEHNLNFSGGSEKFKFYLSGRYQNRKGIYKINPDVLDTYTIRNRINIKPKEWLEIGNSINVFNKRYTHPATNTRNVNGADNSEDWRKYTYHASPLYLPTNPDGSLIIKGAYTNNRDIADGTFADLIYGKSKGEEKDLELFNTTNFVLSPFDGFKIKGDYSFRNRNQSEWVRIISTPYTNQPNGEGVSLYKPNTQVYKELERKSLYQAINAYGEYKLKLNEDIGTTVLAGFNQEWNTFKRNIASRNGNISETLNSFNLATGDNIFLTSSEEEWAIRAAFYRFSFDIYKKYLIEFNGRFDLSSRFPKEDRLGYFPSASVGWIISKENFWQKLNTPINDFKIRASYGELGNQNVGAYDYISTFSVDQSNYIVEDAQINYLTSPQPISSNFTWERAKNTNLGVDLALYKNKLTTSFDWFQRDVVDMLTQGKQLPSVFGANEPNENAADLRTRGFELTLAWKDQFKLGSSDFKYNASFVLGDSRTFITKFDNPNGDINQFYVGKELGEIWGYTVEGFFQTDDEYLNHADQTLVNQRITNNYLINHPVAGDIKFADLNGDGVISPGSQTLDNHGDLKRIGNTNPRYNYGVRLGFEYKGFDLNVFGQGIVKRDWNPGTDNGYFWGPFSRQYNNFYPQSIEANSWTPENPNAYFPRLAVYADRGGPYEGGQLGVNSDKYLQNAAYFRIKNITIGYSLPKKLIEKLKIDNVRFYATGMNLFTFSPLYKNNPDRTVDPEQLGDGNAYPFTKTYAFGIDVKL